LPGNHWQPFFGSQFGQLQLFEPLMTPKIILCRSDVEPRKGGETKDPACLPIAASTTVLDRATG
jgi:hypothetical protein